MSDLSPRALLTIIQAIEYQRDHVLGQLDRGEQHLANWGKSDLLEANDDLESTLEEIEALYNDARARNSSMIPFTELLKNKR
ncbi:MAG: hypothetical protein QM790_00870 [Nibricoccus sp.]